jgi:hypothetical protein
MFSKQLFRAGVALAAGLAFSSFASAQATRTWVSGVGDDVNPCSRTAPCKTFAGAISKTAANGEISVLDPGGFGAVTITKSMTIDGNGQVSSILGSGTNGVFVNGANVNVILRNMTINGNETGIDGVRFVQGRSLTLDNVTIQQFNATNGNGNGVNFAPNSVAASTATLTITDSVIVQNGGSSGFGVIVKPTGLAKAEAVLDHVVISQSRTTGLRVDANATVTVRDSTISNNVNSGVQAGAGAQVNLDNVTTSNNGFNGVKTEGAGALVMMADCSVFGNTTGINPQLGQILSFGTNRVAGNDTDGVFSGPLMQK